MAVSGTTLKTPHGRICVGDLAVFRDEGGHVGRGFVRGFFRLRDEAGAQTFYANVSACASEGAARYRAHVTPTLVHADLLFGACAYYKKDGIIHALELERVPVG